MKRTAAIRGQTPYFIRWAIEFECPFREIFPQRIPETTFRQLRSLRELSVARHENRIFQGICLHPSIKRKVDRSKPLPTAQALGFPIAEVLDLVGGKTLLDQTCGNCPANASIQPNSWAGCYGGVATDLTLNFQHLLQGVYQHGIGHPTEPQFDLIQMVNSWLIENDRYLQLFQQRYPDESGLFFTFWVESPIDRGRLVFLHQLFTDILEKGLDPIPKGSDPFGDRIFTQQQNSAGLSASNPIGQDPEPSINLDDLRQMILGMEKCIEHRLSFHAELVPTGHSDGIHWWLHAHCGRCKKAWTQSQRECTCCGSKGRYQNEIKLKVLGLRPYLRLAEIIGSQPTEQLLADYRSVD